MISHTQATLECEVCGAAWGVTGELYDFREELPNWLRRLGIKFMAHEPPVCPECGEAEEWDIAKPEGVQ